MTHRLLTEDGGLFVFILLVLWPEICSGGTWKNRRELIHNTLVFRWPLPSERHSAPASAIKVVPAPKSFETGNCAGSIRS